MWETLKEGASPGGMPAAVAALEKTGKHKNVVRFCGGCPVKALNKSNLFFAPVMDVIIFN